MYAFVPRDVGFVGVRGLTCTNIALSPLARRWRCWHYPSDLRFHEGAEAVSANMAGAEAKVRARSAASPSSRDATICAGQIVFANGVPTSVSIARIDRSRRSDIDFCTRSQTGVPTRCHR